MDKIDVRIAAVFKSTEARGLRAGNGSREWFGVERRRRFVLSSTKKRIKKSCVPHRSALKRDGLCEQWACLSAEARF